LLTIGLLLTAEAFDQHVSKGYVYFAMAFSLVVEMFNIRMRVKKQKAVALRRKYSAEDEAATHAE
jgi:predicted tellurium resistance membrane protein TerC